MNNEPQSCLEELLNDRISTVFNDEDKTFENSCIELEEDLEDEDYYEIVELCDTYINNNPIMLKAYKKRSEAYWKLGDFEESLNDAISCMMILNQYSSISTITKDFLPEIILHIGKCLKELNKLKKAISVFFYGIDTINSQYKTNPPYSILLEIYMELGLSYAQLDDYESAINYFTKAIELSESINTPPELCYAFYEMRGFTYIKIIEFEKAIKDFIKAIEINNKCKRHIISTINDDCDIKYSEREYILEQIKNVQLDSDTDTDTDFDSDSDSDKNSDTNINKASDNNLNFNATQGRKLDF